MVERLLCTQDVRSSSLLSSKNNPMTFVIGLFLCVIQKRRELHRTKFGQSSSASEQRLERFCLSIKITKTKREIAVSRERARERNSVRTETRAKPERVRLAKAVANTRQNAERATGLSIKEFQDSLLSSIFFKKSRKGSFLLGFRF